MFPIAIPPLRERPGDIPALVHHFLERKTRQLKLAHNPVLADEAIDSLLRYDWPGNVREVENIVERALIVCRDAPLCFDLGHSQGFGQAREPTPRAQPEGRLLSLDEMTTRHIQQALELAGGKIHGSGGAGELLGINPNTLRSRMRKLGVPFGRQD